MIIADKKYLVNGNTALVPERKRERDEEAERYKRIKESQKEALRRKKQLKLKRQAGVIMSIFISFIIGITIIYRYSEIYTMQRGLTDIQNEEKEMQGKNEDLKYYLSQYDDINEVQKTATDKLHMVQPDNSKAVYANLDKKLIRVTEDENTSSDRKGLLEEIKSKLFSWR